MLYSADGLDKILRNNPSGSFCLGQDIDLASIPNWMPIASFGGNFDGSSCTTPSKPATCKSYRIKNLTINSSAQYVGLFANLTSGASIQNVGLSRVNVVATNSRQVGGLAGWVDNVSISNSYVTGSITVTTKGGYGSAWVGGLVGYQITGSITRSHSGVRLSISKGLAGGLVGLAAGSVNDSYAYGSVNGGSWTDVGGLVGILSTSLETVERSYASGNVTGGADSRVGGLIGVIAGGQGHIVQSFATGSATGDARSKVGGLVGDADQVHLLQTYATGDVAAGLDGVAGGLIGTLRIWSVVESYATGLVSVGANGRSGGLIGYILSSELTVSDSYWDKESTHQPTSEGGAKALTDRQIKSHLPDGFDPTVWGISYGVSYPYFKSLNTWLPMVSSVTRDIIPGRMVIFRSTLAAEHSPEGQSSIAPIGQLQSWQYHVYDRDTASTACKGAVYTMLGRTIGDLNPTFVISYPNDGSTESLSLVKIDYFLNASGFAIWPVPGKPNANEEIARRVVFRNSVRIISDPLDSNAADFNRVDMISNLDQGRLLMIRGCTTLNGQCTKDNSDGSYKHWMLATVLKKDPSGNVLGIVANDPELGQQVTIDMDPSHSTYRQVIDPPPAKYSTQNLANFVFTAMWYYSVQLVHPSSAAAPARSRHERQ